jgi:hypothetical protein
MYICSTSNTSLGKQVGGELDRAKGKTLVKGSTTKQRATHFDLDDTHRIHAWLRANLAAFGRSVIGPGLSISADPIYGDEATSEERELLQSFYFGIEGRDFNNISDWYSAMSKIYRTAGQFRLFGQASWELRSNGFDEVVSYDVIPGMLYPNCKEDGSFKDPPFYQYLTSATQMHPLEVDPQDIVFFIQPDFGTRLFSTDFEALTEYVLPTDIYLNTAMRSLLENHRTPMGVFSLDENATPEDVKNMTALLDNLYRGAINYGKSAVVVRGQTSFKDFSAPITDLPFKEGHSSMQDEIEGVSGVSGTKLGRTMEVNRSNMREIRRDYWETTLWPVVKLLSDQMYMLIHRRIFDIRSLRPVFNSPDFLTQVEKATVGMRGRQWSALNTNEFREFVFGYKPIDEDWADSDYMWPSNIVIAGSNPDGTAPVAGDPDDGEEPSSEPNTDSDPPERGDTDNTEEAVKEMKQYAKFYLNRLDKPNHRKFNFNHTDPHIVRLVNDALAHAITKDNVKSVFDAVITGLSEA